MAEKTNISAEQVLTVLLLNGGSLNTYVTKEDLVSWASPQKKNNIVLNITKKLNVLFFHLLSYIVVKQDNYLAHTFRVFKHRFAMQPL
jgi:hypothetical protein